MPTSLKVKPLDKGHRQMARKVAEPATLSFLKNSLLITCKKIHQPKGQMCL